MASVITLETLGGDHSYSELDTPLSNGYDSDSSISLAAKRSLDLSKSMRRHCLDFDQESSSEDENDDNDDEDCEKQLRDGCQLQPSHLCSNENRQRLEFLFNQVKLVGDACHGLPLSQNDQASSGLSSDTPTELPSNMASGLPLAQVERTSSSELPSSQSREEPCKVIALQVKEIHSEPEVAPPQVRCSAPAAEVKHGSTSVADRALHDIQEWQRHKITMELFCSEQKYCSNLWTLQGTFIEPLKKTSMLNQKEIQIMFPRELYTLYEEHCKFLHQLENSILSSQLTLGTCLSEHLHSDHSELLNVYGSYIEDFTMAQKKMKLCFHEVQDFRRFIRKSLKQANSDHHDLSAFLLSPVERIPQYALLLEKLLRFTNHDHSDYELLQSTQDCLKEFLLRMNSLMDRCCQLMPVPTHGTPHPIRKQRVHENVMQKERLNKINKRDHIKGKSLDYIEPQMVSFSPDTSHLFRYTGSSNNSTSSDDDDDDNSGINAAEPDVVNKQKLASKNAVYPVHSTKDGEKPLSSGKPGLFLPNDSKDKSSSGYLAWKLSPKKGLAFLQHSRKHKSFDKPRDDLDVFAHKTDNQEKFHSLPRSASSKGSRKHETPFQNLFGSFKHSFRSKTKPEEPLNNASTQTLKSVDNISASEPPPSHKKKPHSVLRKQHSVPTGWNENKSPKKAAKVKRQKSLDACPDKPGKGSLKKSIRKLFFKKRKNRSRVVELKGDGCHSDESLSGGSSLEVLHVKTQSQNNDEEQLSGNETAEPHSPR